MRTLASLGEGPCAMEDLLTALDSTSSKISPVRSALIKKGVLYSPLHGKIAFTAPLFADFVNRDVQILY